MQRSPHSSRRRPILAGVAILGLLGALFGVAAPAFADHGAGLLSSDLGNHPNPCAADSTAYKLDQFPTVETEPGSGVFVGDETSHTYTSDDGVFTVDITFDFEEGETDPTSLTFANADPAVVQITTKAGSVESTDPYENGVVDEGGTSGSAGPRTDGKEISFVIFCVSTASEETSTPTEVATTTPTEIATTTPTGTGELLGSTSRPRGGGVPNTASEPVSLGQIVTVLSVLLVIGSVGALVVPNLARRTNR